MIKENKVDVIVINESKLDKKTADDTIAIDFILKRLDRNRHGGGVAIYIRETLNVEHRVDFPTGNLEPICKPKCRKPFFIVAWCRPPKYVRVRDSSGDEDFIESLRKRKEGNNTDWGLELQ